MIDFENNPTEEEKKDFIDSMRADGLMGDNERCIIARQLDGSLIASIFPSCALNETDKVFNMEVN